MLWSSVGTALLAGVVCLVLRLVGRALPPAAHAWLWWLVAVKAILGLAWGLPVERPARWAIGPPAAAAQRVATDVDRPLDALNFDPAVLRPDIRPELAAAGLAGAGRAGVFGAVWLIGAIASLAWSARRIRASRALVRAALPVEDRRLLATVAELGAAPGYPRSSAIALGTGGYRSRGGRAAAASAAGASGGAPRRVEMFVDSIALDSLDGDQLRMALAHELIHVRRRDLLLGLGAGPRRAAVLLPSGRARRGARVRGRARGRL